MKIRILSLAAFFALLGSSAFAQSAQLKVGVNLANVSVTNSGRIDDNKQLTSFQIGVVGDLPLGTDFITFQPGVLFTGKGAKTQLGDASSNQYYRATTNPYYIEIPANLVFKLPVGNENKFFFGAGPYAAIGIAGKNKIEGKSLGVAFASEENIRFSNDDPTTTNYEEGAGFGIMRRFDYGLNGLAGIEGKSIVVGVNYGLGLAKLQSGANNNEDDKNKHRILSLSIGFKL